MKFGVRRPVGVEEVCPVPVSQETAHRRERGGRVEDPAPRARPLHRVLAARRRLRPARYPVLLRSRLRPRRALGYGWELTPPRPCSGTAPGLLPPALRPALRRL